MKIWLKITLLFWCSTLRFSDVKAQKDYQLFSSLTSFTSTWAKNPENFEKELIKTLRYPINALKVQSGEKVKITITYNPGYYRSERVKISSSAQNMLSTPKWSDTITERNS